MTDPSPIGGRRFPGPLPIDQALRDVEAATRAAVSAGASTSMVLKRVASGITGSLDGYVERAAADAMANVLAEIRATPVDELRNRERAAISQARAGGGR